MAMGKLKLSLLSYIIVQKRLSLTEIPTSKYETTSPLPVVFFSINSEGLYYFLVSKSSMYDFASRYGSGDMRFLAQLYAGDSKIMPPGSDVVTGRTG